MKKSSLLLPALLLLVSLPCAAQAEPVASGDVPESDADCYNFRLQAVEWDYGGAIGVQWSLAYHQYIDSNGIVLTPDDPAGSWVPFIPGPTIRGEVGDIICVKIQNRIDVSGGQFIEHLMDDMVVHWHGMELANAYDGTPVTQAPIEPGTDYIYRFRLVRPGLYWYHPHWNSMIQNPLGANGALIVDDAVSLKLRNGKVIPHEDRTFVLTLSDLSFQDERGEASGGNYVPFADIASHVGPVYIRDIMGIDGGNMNQNFGDAILVNGVHGYPFNHPLGNSQQFWHEGHRTNAAPTVLKANESVAFHVTNNGMHRFYKIHLAYKTSSSGNWQHSEALYRLGGEGGLLNEARQPNGIFNDGTHGVSTNGTVVGWRLRGIQKRALSDDASDPTGEGLQAVQESTEMLTGEFLLPTSSRVMVAFRVDPSWVEVALRANGFSVINKGRSGPMTSAGLYWEDEAPEDLEIAIFNVEGMASGGDPYVLTAPIEAGTGLRANALIDPSEQLEDLRDIPEADVITNFPSTVEDLVAAGVMVATNEIMENYDITLTGGGIPSINSIQAFWDDTGPFQSTYANTRYVQKDAVVEWTVETQTDHADHPWHLHGFSFQPIKIELRNTNDIYETLYEWDFVEYQDVIYVPAFHRVTYRFKVEDRDFVDTNFSTSEGGVYGRWLAHCHIFKHAHNGMMMEFIVVDETNSLSQRRFPTDIYLRDDVNDDGTIPSSGSISASPDIILRQSLVADADASFGGTNEADNSSLGYQAEAGQDNYIYVRNKNKGYEDATEVTTDVYWSEVSTLVTPDHWNYIDTTGPVDIPTGDGLVVADPITWLQADIPGTGHYCFVGIAGNLLDPKSLTQAEVSGFDVSGMTWEEYCDLIRGNNNVTWRNFNVVDTGSSFAWGPFYYNFRGAFDRGAFNQNRAFDLVIRPPEGFVLSWKIPKAPRGAGPGPDTAFTAALMREIQAKQITLLEEENEFFLLKITEETKLENLPLQKSASYDSQWSLDLADNFHLMGDVANIIGKKMFVGQVYKFPTGNYEVGRVTWKFINLPEDNTTTTTTTTSTTSSSISTTTTSTSTTTTTATTSSSTTFTTTSTTSTTLRISDMLVSTDGVFRIQWDAASGTIYRVSWTSNLFVWPSNQYWDVPDRYLDDTGTHYKAKFYRLDQLD